MVSVAKLGTLKGPSRLAQRASSGFKVQTPDYAPIIGAAQEVENFYMDVGWGTYGFKAAPIAAKCIAQLMATGRTPKLIEPFSPALL